MDTQSQKIYSFIDTEFESSLPTFVKILEIPSSSKAYDPEFTADGLIMKTVEECRDWILYQGIKGLKLDLMIDEGSPFLIVEVDGTSADCPTVLLYGHLDK
jgi:hypothetical protein